MYILRSGNFNINVVGRYKSNNETADKCGKTVCFKNHVEKTY